MSKSVVGPKFRAVLDQVPDNYYYVGVRSNILQRYWHSKKWDKLGTYLSKEGNKKLLDIGCADGTTTYQMSKKSKKMRVVGVDIYKNSIKFARKTYKNIIFKIADAHELPFSDKSFDLITAVETLEHMHDPEKVLAEIYRVSKDNAKLIVVQDTDSELFRVVWWFWLKWKGSVWKNSHLNCVKPDKLLRLIKKSGFKIDTVEYTNFNMEMIVVAYKK